MPGPASPAAALPDLGAAPEFTGIERWLNSEPLSLAQLRGRVVLVDFWTYACINCIRTLPHVNRWAEQYTPQGLTVVGVHTPEFPFERPTANLEAAMRRHGIKHPVAQDNRYGTWKAYSNQYWPATYLIDAQGRILFVSDVWLKKMGYARDAVVGRISSSFLTPSSREYATSVVLPAFFASGRCDAVKYQMVRKDGSIMDVQLSAVLERDEHGQPLHSLAVIQDVTEENAISATLQANEERLTLATSVNQIGIWEIDLQSGRLAWNDTMFSIFGGSRSDFRGTLEDWQSKVHPRDRESMNRILQDAIATHESIDCDFRIVRENGEIRHINSRAIVITDAQDRPVRVLGTNYDISERKEIEQALA